MCFTEKTAMNKRLLIVIFFGVLMGALDIVIIGPALSSIKESFQVDERLLSWVLPSYILFSLISTPLMARLSDMYGRKIIYILDVFLFAMGSFLIVISDSIYIVLLGRAVQGFGAGGIFPVASAVIGDTFPKEKQGAALGMIGAVFGLAFIIGPVLGGLLLRYSWHWLFIINIPIALLLIVSAWFLFPAERNRGKMNFDWLGSLLLIISLVSFDLGITNINTMHFIESITGWHVWPFLVLSAITAPLFYYNQKHSTHPILDVRLLGMRQLRLTYLLALGAGITEVGVAFLPGMVKLAFNITNSQASYALMPLVLALFVGAPLSGNMIDRIGVKKVLMFGTLCISLALGLLSLHELEHWNFYTATVILGFGMSALLGAPLRYIMNMETVESDRATGQGVLNIFSSTGMITSTALVGALIASQGGLPGFRTAFMVLAFLSIFMIAVVLFLKDYK